MSNLITISYGTHPEILESALQILMEAGASLEVESTQLGEEPRKLGYEAGFHDDTIKKFTCSGVLLKTPDDVTPHLLAAFEISDVREIYGDANPAQVYANDRFAIFEPCEANTPSMLNAAIMVLKHFGQDDVVERIEKAMKQVNIENLSADEFAENVIGKLW